MTQFPCHRRPLDLQYFLMSKPKSKKKISRRKFLQGTGTALAVARQRHGSRHRFRSKPSQRPQYDSLSTAPSAASKLKTGGRWSNFYAIISALPERRSVAIGANAEHAPCCSTAGPFTPAAIWPFGPMAGPSRPSKAWLKTDGSTRCSRHSSITMLRNAGSVLQASSCAPRVCSLELRTRLLTKSAPA